MKKWLIEVQSNTEKKIVIVIVGNKSDLRFDQAVDEKIVIKYAEKTESKHFFTSAKNGKGIKEIFAYILDGIKLCFL